MTLIYLVIPYALLNVGGQSITSGLTAIPGEEIHHFLAKLPVDKVWGIGAQTTALLRKYRIFTALEFARQPEAWVEQHFGALIDYDFREQLAPNQTRTRPTPNPAHRYRSDTTQRPASSDRTTPFTGL